MTIFSSLRNAALAVGIAAAALTTGTPREASALMMQDSAALEGGGGGGGTYTPPPATYNKIVYLHGRSMNGWPGQGLLQQSGSSWNHVTLSYNGSARLADATVRNTVKNALSTNCRGSNQCVIVCYSAGCARMLLAFDDLAAAGTPVTNVAWITATASAAGGSEIADAATKWYAKLLSKIFGGSAAIDDDLKVGVMRSNFGYIQNRAPVAMYHLAGAGKNLCRKILFIKICGNSKLPGNVGDGAVPPHSSCGFANRGYYPSCSTAYGAKYTNRVSQQDAFYYADHTEMVGKGVAAASYRLAGTSTWNSPSANLPETSDPDGDLTYDDGDTHSDTTQQITDALGGGNPDPNVVTYDNCGGSTCYNTSPTATYGGGGGGGGGGGTYELQAAY
jgi:hypothetical protein